jgi:EmrB/QacA subfamily drug resistance transporter
MANDKAASRRTIGWIVLSVALANFMAKLDGYIVNISLPTIAHAFHVSTSVVSYVILGYLLTVTSSLLLFGKLCERRGTKKIFISGYIVFVVGSLLCGLSTNIIMLVASRCLQGIGGAMLTTTALPLLSENVPERRLGAAIGVLATASALGLSIGAPLGGFITSFFSWHWIFLINVPVGIVAVILGIKLIPASPAPTQRNRHGFDFMGALLSLAALTALVFSLSLGREKGWASPLILSGFGVGIFLLYVLARWELRHPDPLLNIELLREPPFAFAVLSGCTVFLLVSGNSFLAPFYLELYQGLSPDRSGLVLVTFAVVMMFISPLAGKLADRMPIHILCSIALLIGAGICVGFSATLQLKDLIPVMIFLIGLGAAMGFFVSPNNKAVMTLAPPKFHSIASGFYQTMTGMSQILGVCLFETIFSDSLPGKVAVTALANLKPEKLTQGFRNAYAFAALVCLIGFLLAYMAKSNHRET